MIKGSLADLFQAARLGITVRELRRRRHADRIAGSKAAEAYRKYLSYASILSSKGNKE